MDIATDIAENDEGLLTPTKKTLVDIHRFVIEFSKNLVGPKFIHGGVVYEATLESIENRLKGRKYTNTPVKNAIFVSEEILFKILCEHPFVDGNKRTALMGALMLLALNTKYYVNKKSDARFEYVSPPEDIQIETGKDFELLASWYEPRRHEEIYNLLIKNGIKIRTKNNITEDHIRQYIRLFLLNRIKEVNK